MPGDARTLIVNDDRRVPRYRRPLCFDYIGPYTPASSHLFVAAGFQKWGMTGATVAAAVLSDRLAGRENPWAALSDPNRMTVLAALALAKAQLQVGTKFVGDRLSLADVRSVDDVPAGEARVVRSGLSKVGVYRDEAGSTHGVSLRAPRLPAALQRRGAQLGLPVPRLALRHRGAVLAGPAVQPLACRDLE